MFEARGLDLSTGGMQEVYNLLHEVFPQASHFSNDYLNWQYLDNPIGQAVGSNIYHKGQCVAHFVTQAVRSVFNGLEEKGLLALNIATHQDYRGKGLFKMAGEKTIEEARRQGYKHMIGVANGNSTKVFMRHLNFQLVGPLNVKLGVGRMPASDPAFKCDYKLNWLPRDMTWRLQRPAQNYFGVNEAPGKKIYSKATPVGPYVQMGACAQDQDIAKAPLAFHLNPTRLWMGLDASRDWKGTCYVEVPEKRRPSPLNFIFFDLTNQGRCLEASRLKFDALDFDAY